MTSAPSCAANLPADIRDKVKNGKHLIRDDYMRWQQALGKQGWLVYTWPKKHGGPGFTPAERYIFENICAEEYAPGIIPFGTKMVGPVIYTFGNDEQKAKYLEPIRKSTVWWCQGYSEPGSGSDLASLRTKAEKQGDHYIVNGSKTWNTMGHWADWIFCLVRTDPKAKPQEGISFLLIDMKTPGITVKPIIMADGGHEVNEVFFDNVKVPVANLVGKENEGWTCAKFLLANERLGIAAVPQSKRGVEALKDIARAEQENGKPLIENQSFAEKIADLEIQVTALEYTELRVLSPWRMAASPGRKCRASRSGARRSSSASPSSPWRRSASMPRRICRACCGRARTRSRSARPMRIWRRRATSTRARPRSTAAATRSRRASSARWCWGCGPHSDHERVDLASKLEMDLALKPEHKAFADEVRAFARANLSPATKAKTFSGKHYDKDDHIQWQKALGRQGWLAYTWPKKYGGPGWDVTQRFLFENVLAEEGAPRIIPFGPKMVGPVIYTFGTDEQKERFLPGIRSSEVSWCQGYSEPGAGSDLASPCAPARCVKATTTSSTARRPGPRSPIGATGSSAWCAPIPRPRRRRASPSC